MASQYTVLDNAEPAGAWEGNKKKLYEYYTLKYGKKAAKKAAATVVNHFTFNVGGAIFEAPALYKTTGHITGLKRILDDGTVWPCSCLSGSCKTLAAYALAQKEKKQVRAGVGLVPVVGTLQAIKGAIHGLTKTDKGGTREANARLLWSKARNGCVLARAILRELLGGVDDADTADRAEVIYTWDQGWRIIKDKLAST